jgi:hypothetical protein
MDRGELHTMLISVLGSTHVYPCIVYSRSGVKADFADDRLYINKKRYMVTVIDSNPDSLIPDKLAALPLCSFDRHFTSNNLNHDVYSMYF